jgi:uncharacterized membrane protein
MGRSGNTLWPVIGRALFVIAIAYAIAFVILKSKFPWLVAGVVCGIVEILISVPYLLQNRTTWQSIALPLVEWFVVGSIAALVAMMVPVSRPDSPDEPRDDK